MANQTITNGFTYCWSDHKHAKVYVGIHLGALDDGYVCSSKSMLKEYKERPQDFTRKILFKGPYEECAKFETALIAGLFKQDKNTFYNRSNGRKILFDDVIRSKISKKAKGRKLSASHLEKMLLARAGKPGPRKGVALSEEVKTKISNSKKGIVTSKMGHKHTLETRKKMSDSAKNKPPITEETRIKLSESAKADWAKRKQEKSLGY
jgi:hypothetical protein